MKKIITEDGCLYLGTAREFCSLYKNFEKREIAWPVFSDFPKFNMEKYYGLSISDYDCRNERWLSIPEMQVVAGDTALAIAFDL